ncbi:hypothetical protein AVEN_71351-1 [Araneus ventricosus]|uniref:Uncharacterized protein n=1 Tax=Araneus ventricosus TaxID=182803 RepID=A0A4Y2BKD7_ARAVE|nr:hypothetical protein AVEN_71351-1 [Araneus ventricosus]
MLNTFQIQWSLPSSLNKLCSIRLGRAVNFRMFLAIKSPGRQVVKPPSEHPVILAGPPRVAATMGSGLLGSTEQQRWRSGKESITASGCPSISSS